MIKAITAENLKKMRKSMGLTQSQMAENIGISQTYYSELETGKKPITPKLLQGLTVLYGAEKLGLNGANGVPGDTMAHPERKRARIVLEIGKTGLSLNCEGMTPAEAVAYLQMAQCFYEQMTDAPAK